MVNALYYTDLVGNSVNDQANVVEVVRDNLCFCLVKESVANVFCPTGKGGGVDPTCSPKSTATGEWREVEFDEWRAWRDGEEARFASRVEEGLSRAIESGEIGRQADQYREAAASVVQYMPDGALVRLNENVEEIKFYDSSLGLTEAVYGGAAEERIKAGRLSGGAWAHQSDSSFGVLYLDGGKDTKDAYDQSSTSSTGRARDNYAHEFSHAIDGIPLSAALEAEMSSAARGGRLSSVRGSRVSASPAWRDAYAKEIDTDLVPLSDYAKVSRSEGFAEYGRLVFSNPRGARDGFPECWKVWQDIGLVKKTPGSYTVPTENVRGTRLEEIFQESDQVGNIHVDVVVAKSVANVFCPTGKEGGQDPTWSPGSMEAAIAKASAVRVAKDVQQYSEEHNEPMLAKSLEGQSLQDNEPMDVVTEIDGVTHGVELKTMTVGKNNRIYTKEGAIQRKKSWERKNKAKGHTVVFDDTKVFNANGPGEHDFSKRRIFYRRGYGSFRVENMQEVGSVKELRSLMSKRRNQISEAAGGTKKTTANVAKELGEGEG